VLEHRDASTIELEDEVVWSQESDGVGTRHRAVVESESHSAVSMKQSIGEVIILRLRRRAEVTRKKDRTIEFPSDDTMLQL
jgi:hypothetical protein